MLYLKQNNRNFAETNTVTMAEYAGMEPTSSIDHMTSIKCRLDSGGIPVLVQLYKPLIVRCLKAESIVHHLDKVISTSMLANTYKTYIV